MTESNQWAEQWFKAQQQFVDAWSDMAKSGAPGNTSQTDLWAQGFDMWRKASGTQAQPDIQQAINKCMDMGKEYFAMAEQVSKSISAGTQPTEAINQWMEQLKQSLQQFGAMPGFDGSATNDFMKQWFNPTSSWQQMAAGLAPMNQTAWQMPGMNTSSFNLGEMIDPLGSMLEAPSVGYFREPQEKQQKGIQLTLEYHQANQAFNQAFLRVAIESIQGFQSRLLKIDTDTAPKSLRGLYDLWVEVSEEHYAEFAMSEEYQDLYGDMVNRLMIVKKHYSEITDDTLRAMNLPNTREVDTMQQRLQQLRRENILLKKEIGEIRSMLQQVVDRPAAAAPAAPAPKKAPRSATTATAASKAPRNSSTAKAAASKAPVKKTVARKAAPKKKPAVTKASKGA
jgi:class III poly(R)-hydroxyalkanoic acid synthase PhaE subunit